MARTPKYSRYIPEQQPNGQWRVRDLDDGKLRGIAVRYESEAKIRAERMNRDFMDADWDYIAPPLFSFANHS